MKLTKCEKVLKRASMQTKWEDDRLYVQEVGVVAGTGAVIERWIDVSEIENLAEWLGF